MANPVIVGALVLVLLALGWVLSNKSSRRLPKDAIPIPRVKGGLPFFGVAFDMLKSVPWDLMTKWALDYGPIYRFPLFGKDCVCVADPDLLREIMHTQMNSFRKDTNFTYRYVIGRSLKEHACAWIHFFS